MPRHSTSTTFIKGQTHFKNGEKMGREKGCPAWNLGKKMPFRTAEWKQHQSELMKDRKMPWLQSAYNRGKNPSKHEIIHCKICEEKFDRLKVYRNKVYCCKECKDSDHEALKISAAKSAQTSRARGHNEKTRERMKNGGAIKARIANIKANRSSRPQLRLANLLGAKHDKDLEQNYYINCSGKRMFPDIVFPKEKVIWEFNGKYWHDDADDQKRKEILKNHGWMVYFVNEDNLHEIAEAKDEAREFLREKAIDDFAIMFNKI